MNSIDILKEFEGKTIKKANISKMDGQNEQLDLVFADTTCATVYDEDGEIQISYHK